MDIIDRIRKHLDARYPHGEAWEEIEERGGDPCEEWNNYLDSIGLVASASYEAHWGEGGVFDCIDTLVKVLNADTPPRPVYCVDFNDGTSSSTIYIFDREKVTAALQAAEPQVS